MKSRPCWLLVLLLALATPALAAETAESPRAAAYSAALGDLQAERTRMEVEGSTVERATAVSEAFFARVDVAALSLDQLVEVVALAPFNYGDKAKALALALTDRLTPLSAAPDRDGALAAALRLELAAPAGVARPQRIAWATAYLQHPGLVALLQSDQGALALAAANSGTNSDPEKEIMLGLVDRLDASRATAAASAAAEYWHRLIRFVPAGAPRQALRAKLAAYVAAALATPVGAQRRERRDLWEKNLALLNGAEARGVLMGQAAPEIEFLWSARPEWQTLGDVRGKGGKVIVLDFWATWCGPCVEAFPHLRALTARYRGFPVEIVGVTSVQGAVFGLRDGTVNCKGDPEKEFRLLADYIRQRDITWPVVVSRAPAFNPDYGIQGLPSVVLIAPDGTVRHSAPGFSPVEKQRRIDALLAEFQLPHPPADHPPAAKEKSP